MRSSSGSPSSASSASRKRICCPSSQSRVAPQPPEEAGPGPVGLRREGQHREEVDEGALGGPLGHEERRIGEVEAVPVVVGQVVGPLGGRGERRGDLGQREGGRGLLRRGARMQREGGERRGEAEKSLHDRRIGRPQGGLPGDKCTQFREKLQTEGRKAHF